MNVEEDGDTGLPEEIVKEATDLGWVPKDKFRGPEDKWIDADEFVEKGRHVLPIVIENNKRLKQELLTRDKKIDTLTQSVAASQKAIDALQKVHTEATARAVETAIARTKEEIKEARESGDVDAELALQDKLNDLKTAKKETTAAATAPEKKEEPAAKDDELSPEFKAWMAEHPWFGNAANPEDKKRTKAILRIGEDLRDEGVTELGEAFMNLCLEEEARRNTPAETRGTSKVESGSLGRSTSGGTKGKSYADMPKEAKEACMQFASTLVGPDKAYKNEADWQASYAKTYWAE